MKFTLLPLSTVKTKYSDWYNDKAVYWNLVIDNKEVALYSIKPLTENICEISLLVYDGFKGSFLTKERAWKLINYPLKHGFKSVIIGTKIKSMVRLDKRFGFTKMHKDKTGKTWAVREFKHGQISSTSTTTNARTTKKGGDS